MKLSLMFGLLRTLEKFGIRGDFLRIWINPTERDIIIRDNNSYTP